MDLTAAHTGFVVGAYALSAVVLFGLLIHTIARDRSLRAEAARLEMGRRGTRP